MSATKLKSTLLINLATAIDRESNWMIRTSSEPMFHQTIDIVKQALVRGDTEITISRLNDYVGESITEHSITIENDKYIINKYCQGINYETLEFQDMVDYIKELYIIDLNK
ncbi:hypothetical protein [Photobacterium lutimaris]|uniref:Uncharacterized protein n=1 Tax=Photobacterium lutimaris TaxID=388278 RepID=A0A2T3ITQ8_9GAMM|nr:hypothetical protein [Photobacterium lutimaris]PSU31744.1 hypothetical protein C9I99_21400 [Photobacterium lutimaris]TDR72612.1 hypothetical protein DFP78_11388 [Photobacterium lutimaris]